MKTMMTLTLITLLSFSCTKRESISDYPAAPNTSAEKSGDMAGEGSSSSLGSENPGGPNNPETPPATH